MIKKFAGTLLLFFVIYCNRQPVPVIVDSAVAKTITQYSLGIGITRRNSVLNGTAFFAPQPGYLFTNQHVVRNANTQYYVTVNGSDFFPVKIEKSDADLDLALLTFQSEELLKLQNSLPAYTVTDDLSPGLPVVATGSAFGLHRTFLQGIVSHTHRTGLIGQPGAIHYIQTQGVTYSGMSGAPVFDLKGRLIGINRAAYGYSATTGTGLIIPANIALDWAEKLY